MVVGGKVGSVVGDSVSGPRVGVGVCEELSGDIVGLIVSAGGVGATGCSATLVIDKSNGPEYTTPATVLCTKM